MLAAAAAHADARRVEAYLAAHHRGRTWDVGPTRIDGAAIRSAYGAALQFYMVHSSPLRTPADYRRGLRAARTEVERREVTAAVASLTAGTYTPAGELRPDEVELARDGGAWVGTAQRVHARMVSVWFDARGRVVRVNAGDLISMPPSVAR